VPGGVRGNRSPRLLVRVGRLCGSAHIAMWCCERYSKEKELENVGGKRYEAIRQPGIKRPDRSLRPAVWADHKEPRGSVRRRPSWPAVVSPLKPCPACSAHSEAVISSGPAGRKWLRISSWTRARSATPPDLVYIGV
jgi:hypothetical protein